MSDEDPLDALLREAVRASGLIPRADWDAQARQCLTLVAGKKGFTVERLLLDRARWPALLPGLLARLTVGETHFFRHAAHFDRLVDAIAARFAEGARDSPIILSAGCATGEEPYSAAIAIHRRLGAPGLARVRIFAVDISAPSIERARAGCYGMWAFRDAPEWLNPGYFTCDTGQERHLADMIRPAVTFEVGHFVDFTARIPDGSVDAVLFRNVAIYLQPEMVEAGYREIHRVLVPGGLLLVAPADPRPSTAWFMDDGHESTSIYRRRSNTDAQAAAPASRRRRRVQRRSPGALPGIRPSACAAPLPESGAERVHRAARAEARASGEFAEARDIEAKAMRLGDRGDLAGALAAATYLVEQHPTNCTGYWVRARIALGAGETEAAVDDLRRTLLLEPQHRLARYWYVVALWTAGRIRQAIDQARVLEPILGSAGAALLEDEHTTAQELLDAVRFIKEGLT